MGEQTGKFQKELASLVNRYSQESLSDTPDFILAEYIMGCLQTFEKTVRARDKWYGNEFPHPGDSSTTTEDT